MTANKKLLELHEKLRDKIELTEEEKNYFKEHTEKAAKELAVSLYDDWEEITRDTADKTIKDLETELAEAGGEVIQILKGKKTKGSKT